MFYGPPPGALLPIGGHKGYGLSVFCEILAGALTGGRTTNPDNPTAGRLVNNMLSLVFDAEAFCGAEAFSRRDRSPGSVGPGLAARDRGGEVLLPGELERRNARALQRDGIALDAVTRSVRIADACARVASVSLPRGIRRVRRCRANPVRTRLAAAASAFGVMAFEFFTPGLAPVLAAAGAEFVLLDMEHSGVGHRNDESADRVCPRRGHRADGASAVAYHLIAPVLDAGALGIMAPMVETREQAETLVTACRYRPQGRRGLGFGVAHDRYTGGAACPRCDAANDAILTIALIESARGVDNAQAILSTPGLDWAGSGTTICPTAWAASSSSTTRATWTPSRGCFAAAAAAGKPLGWLVGSGEAAQARAAARIPVHLHRPRSRGIAKCAGAGDRACARKSGPALIP